MTHLFVYGTLMSSDIMEAVSGNSHSGEPALLHNHSCRAVIDQPYPAIVACDGENVNGLLYRNISDSEWERLDLFEGDAYPRKTVNVILSSGEKVVAQMYMPTKDFMKCVSESRWDFNEFMKNDRQRFENGYKGYDAIE